MLPYDLRDVTQRFSQAMTTNVVAAVMQQLQRILYRVLAQVTAQDFMPAPFAPRGQLCVGHRRQVDEQPVESGQARESFARLLQVRLLIRDQPFGLGVLV